MSHQSQEKKEEGLRGWWVDVSLGFLLVVLGEPNIYHDSGVFYKNKEVVVEDIFGKYLKILSQRNCDSYWIIKNITLQIRKRNQYSKG